MTERKRATTIKLSAKAFADIKRIQDMSGWDISMSAAIEHALAVTADAMERRTKAGEKAA